MASQAISFKLAELSVGSSTLKAQIAADAKIFVLMRNFIIELPLLSLPTLTSFNASPTFVHRAGRRISHTES
jgi:hypothetical protein